MPNVTPIYAGLIALLFLALSARVIFYRRSAQVSLGDGADKELLSRIRAQANCAEYAPLGLLLLLLAELQGTPVLILHLLGAALLAGRVMHGVALSIRPQRLNLRVAGMALTLTAIGIAAILCVVLALF